MRDDATVNKRFAQFVSSLGDRYEVESELGSGGMAVVYAAQDRKHKRRVAIKVLRPELAAVIGPERFLREIEICANLNHPHVLPLFDSGETAGFLYYVMPYLEGETLRDRLNREQTLPVDEALRIARDVASALDFAHSRGVVHRDVKPENILFQGGHAVVSDFGIAKAVSSVGETQLTETGLSIGTPSYMSPEQASGEVEIDGRSDVFSLGSVLYEMLTGSPPFSGPNAQAVVAKVLSQPIRPTGRDGVSQALEQVISKALAKAPADRYATASEFAAAISSPHAEGDGAGLQGLSLGKIRVRWPWVISAAAVLFAGVMVLRLPSLLRSGGEGRRVVIGLIQNQTGDPALDDVGSWVANYMTSSLQRTGTFDVVPISTAVQAAGFIASSLFTRNSDSPARSLARETGAQLVISGSYFGSGSDIEFHIQITDATRDSLLLVLDPVTAPRDSPRDAIITISERSAGFLASHFDERLPQGTFSSPPALPAHQEFIRGLEAYLRSEWQTALPQFLRAYQADTTFVQPLLFAGMAVFRVAYLSHDLAQMDSILTIVGAHSDRLTPYELAWFDYQRALITGNANEEYRTSRRAALVAPESHATYEHAVVALNNRRPREALEFLATLDPERGPMRGFFPYWIQKTRALHALGDYEAELSAADEARVFHPDNMFALELEAKALAAMGRVSEVESRFEIAADMLQLSEIADPAGQLWYPDVLKNVGEELRAHGHAEAAQQAFVNAIEWYENQPPLPPGDTLVGYFALFQAVAHYNSTDPSHLRRARDTFAARLQMFDNETSEAWDLTNMAVAAAQLGDTTAVRGVIAFLNDFHPSYNRGLREWFLAMCHSLIGEKDVAIAWLDVSLTNGMNPARRWVHASLHFAPLADEPRFRELMRPIG